jgi:hypothetical protein
MNSQLHKAIEQGDLQAVVSAIERGADVEAADMHGASGLPLRTACFRGHAEIVVELIRRGADIQAANADGIGAPVRMAARGKHWQIVDLLLTHGAELPPGVEIPVTDRNERRKRRDRRSKNYGPPNGLKERRCSTERRTTFVREVELSDDQWSAFFTEKRSKKAHLHEHHDPASVIFDRVRD